MSLCELIPASLSHHCIWDGPPSTSLTSSGTSNPSHAPLSALTFLCCIPSIPCLCLYVLILKPLLLSSLVLSQITANTVHSLSSALCWNITLGSPPRKATPAQGISLSPHPVSPLCLSTLAYLPHFSLYVSLMLAWKLHVGRDFVLLLLYFHFLAQFLAHHWRWVNESKHSQKSSRRLLCMSHWLELCHKAIWLQRNLGKQVFGFLDSVVLAVKEKELVRHPRQCRTGGQRFVLFLFANDPHFRSVALIPGQFSSWST